MLRRAIGLDPLSPKGDEANHLVQRNNIIKDLTRSVGLVVPIRIRYQLSYSVYFTSKCYQCGSVGTVPKYCYFARGWAKSTRRSKQEVLPLRSLVGE